MKTIDQTSRRSYVRLALWMSGAWAASLLACSSGPSMEPGPIASGGAGANVPATPQAGGSGASGAAAGAAGSATGGGAAPLAGVGGSMQPSAPMDAGDQPTGDGSSSPEPDAGPSSDGGRVSVLPPITDPGSNGPFAIMEEQNLDGLSTHILIAPRELGLDGIKHPILIWINGAGAGSTSYRAMLDNLAAHGFFLLDDKQSSFESMPEVEAQRAAIDWVIAQAEMQGGPYFGKIDPTRIAIAGHSLGSVSTFGNVGDPRIKTSIHMAGGLVGNPEGVNETWIDDMHAPAAFLCGDRDTNGLPRVRNDFAAAPPAVPLFFGLLAGVGHTDEFNQPNGGRWGRIVHAWLRWQLADDESFAPYFVGASCQFCQGDFTAMKRGID